MHTVGRVTQQQTPGAQLPPTSNPSHRRPRQPVLLPHLQSQVPRTGRVEESHGGGRHRGMELLLALQSGSELTVDKGGVEVGAVEQNPMVACEDQPHA